MARLVAVVESIARPSVTSPLLLYKHGNRNNLTDQSRVLSAAEGLVGMANGTGRLTAAQRGRPDLRDTAAPSAGTCGRGMKFWAGRRAAVGGVDAGGFSANAEASQSRMGLLLGIRLEISADGRPRSRSVGGRPKEEMAPQEASRQARKQGKGVRQEERGKAPLAGCLIFRTTNRPRNQTCRSNEPGEVRVRCLLLAQDQHRLSLFPPPRTILGGAGGVLGPKREISICPSQVCGAAVLPNQISPSSLTSTHAAFNVSETYLASVSHLFPLFSLPFFPPYS